LNRDGSEKYRRTRRPKRDPELEAMFGKKPAGPTSVGDILSKLTVKSPLGKKLRQARIWDQWEDLAGPRLAPHGRPYAVRNKTLFIEVDSTVWMNRFSYSRWDILQRINLLYKRELISDIFVMLSPEAEAVDDEFGNR